VGGVFGFGVIFTLLGVVMMLAGEPVEEWQNVPGYNFSLEFFSWVA